MSNALSELAARVNGNGQKAESAPLSETEKLRAYVAQLEAQVKAQAAKPKAEPQITVKVSQKGAVSVYGLGRWPVTLYAGQWERLLEKSEDIKAFIAKHESELSRKEAA